MGAHEAQLRYPYDTNNDILNAREVIKSKYSCNVLFTTLSDHASTWLPVPEVQTDDGSKKTHS